MRCVWLAATVSTVEILLMSLFYLIEEHDRVGAPWNSFEELIAFSPT